MVWKNYVYCVVWSNLQLASWNLQKPKFFLALFLLSVLSMMSNHAYRCIQDQMINYCKRLSFTCRLFYTSSAINASTVSFSSWSSAARVHGENDSLHPTPPPPPRRWYLWRCDTRQCYVRTYIRRTNQLAMSKPWSCQLILNVIHHCINQLFYEHFGNTY